MKKNIFLFILLLLLAGCSNQPSQSYPSAFKWNNITYAISSTVVSSNQLGNEVGKITRKTESMPLENGDSNDPKVGSKIFEIKDIKSEESLAIDIDGTTYKATKLQN